MSCNRHTRFLLYLVTVSSCFAIAASADCSEAPLPRTIAHFTAGDPVTVVCLGDSVTGIYYHTGGQRAYPEMLKIALGKQFPKCRVRVVNAGVSGNTTADGLARLQQDVLVHNPELVTIMFGLNDVKRVPVDRFRANLTQIIGQCHDAGAEVLLCTPNGVEETDASQIRKLVEYNSVIHSLGREVSVPVADVYAAYEAIHGHDPVEFALLLSDPIHPNMDGHKLTASVIAQVIAGDKVSLADEQPSSLGFQHSLTLLADDQPIKVLAMPPYDALIGPALRSIKRNASVSVSTWDVAGKSLSEIETDAKRVRDLRPDLVIVAVPWIPSIDSIPVFARTYGGILNRSLSYGQQEWDVLAVLPSVDQPAHTDNQRRQEELMQRLIRAQDLSPLMREHHDPSSADQLLMRWLKDQGPIPEKSKKAH